MVLHGRFILVATIVSMALSPVVAHAQTTLSVIASSEEGLWAPDLERIEKALRKSLAARSGLSVQSRAETNEHFGEARTLGVDCDAHDVGCASKLGVIAGADHVLLMRAAALEGRFFLTLLLVDVGAPDRAKRIEQWVPSSGPGFDLALQEATVRLLAPAEHVGNLKLALEPSGALVRIDGKPVEPDFAGVIKNVPAGRRVVDATLDGHRPFRVEVDVLFAQTVELAVVLETGDTSASPPIHAAPAAPALAHTEVNRALVAGITAGGGIALAIPATVCCAFCPCPAAPLPILCGALGSGGGAYIGALFAGVDWGSALLPALAAAGVGGAGGFLGLVIGSVVGLIAAPSLGVNPADVFFGIFRAGGNVAAAPNLFATLGLLVAPVLVVGSLSAIAGAGVTYLMLPSEIATEEPEAERAAIPPGSPARAMAY